MSDEKTFDEAADAERVAQRLADEADEPRTVTGDLDDGVEHPLDPKGGTISGTLPGGYQDAAGVVHRTFIVREMNGEEEDLLGGKGVWVARLNQVIAKCLVSVGTIADQREIAHYVQVMPVVDRSAILVALYRLSHGDKYVFRKLKCPGEDCGVEDTHSVNLRTLEVRDMKHPGQLNYVTACSNGRVVKWHVMTGTDEAWMYDVGKKRRENHQFSLGLLARIDEIDGVPVVRGDGSKKVDAVFDAAMLRVQHELTSSARRELREEIEEAEGDYDTAVEFVCKEKDCGETWEGFIPVGWPNFFFPSVKRRR